MDWIHIIQNIIISINLIGIFIIFIKMSKNRTIKYDVNLLNKNIEVLSNIYNKQNCDDLKNTIELYTEVETILKVSKSSEISLIKYNYSKTYITLDFLFSINDKGELTHDDYLNNLPATSNILNLRILKSEGLDNIKSNDLNMHYHYNDIGRIYFKNIEKEKIPLGYIVFTYLEDYDIDEQQQEEINRISIKISKLL